MPHTLSHTHSPPRTWSQHTLRLVLCLFLFILISGCSQTSENDLEILAFVGDSGISIDDYERRYSDLTQRQGLPANEALRLSLLDEMVDEQVMLNAAQRMQLGSTPEAERQQRADSGNPQQTSGARPVFITVALLAARFLIPPESSVDGETLWIAQLWLIAGVVCVWDRFRNLKVKPLR